MALDAVAADRVRELARLVQHPDPSQLAYQLVEIAGDRTYLQHGVTLVQGDVVLDVGANVGVAAAFFATQCGAQTVHCFEPVGPICATLRENVDALPACAVHELGLAATPGRREITYYPNASAMSGLFADPARDRAQVEAALLNLGADDPDAELAGRFDDAQTLSCELTTVSAFLRAERLERVDLLKVDVEHAEAEVLAGVDDADWPAIRQVVAEVHDEDGRLATLDRDLTARGFRVVREQEPALRGTPVHMLYATRPG